MKAEDNFMTCDNDTAGKKKNDFVSGVVDIVKSYATLHTELLRLRQLLDAATSVQLSGGVIEKCPAGGYHAVHYGALKGSKHVGCNSPSPLIAYEAYLSASDDLITPKK
jgi:hypothetical protein